MANTSADEVAELKQELDQFLLPEITSAQGAHTFRKEVSAEVAAVIDQVLNERLTPALQRIEAQAAEQANALTARVDAALRRFEQGAPVAAASAETDQKVAELTARLDEMRSRMVRMEEQGRRAVAQPIAAPKLADERIAVTPKNASLVPRWALWVIILLLLLTALGLGNIYLERMTAPEPIMPAPVFVPPANTTPSTPVPTPASSAPAPASSAPANPVSVPPQNPPSNPAVTPTPINTTPPSTPASPPAHAHAIPADFAIERGWLAAQPFAVEGSVARHASTSSHITTLKALACGRSASCTADSLFGASEATQFIALQMVMSQIGDRFCTPRRGVHVTGVVDDGSLGELASVTQCAGLHPTAPCKNGDNKLCAPDAATIEAGDVNALSQLLRWGLWKIGSM